MINRQSVIATVLSAATVAAAACSDAPTAAPSTASLQPAPARHAAGTLVSTMQQTVGPTSSVSMTFGNHKLTIPAGAICDLATSGYGPTMWNAPCTPSKKSVTITVKFFTNAAGRPEADFSPALRFVPSKTVTLHLMDKTASLDATSKVLYCATPSTPCIDESLTDASLASSRDPKTGYVFRRIKHFSGYNVVFGRGRTTEGGV